MRGWHPCPFSPFFAAVCRPFALRPARVNDCYGWFPDLSRRRRAHRVGQKSNLRLRPAIAPFGRDYSTTRTRPVRSIHPIRPAASVVLPDRVQVCYDDILRVGSNRACGRVHLSLYGAVRMPHLDSILDAQSDQQAAGNGGFSVSGCLIVVFVCPPGARRSQDLATSGAQELDRHRLDLPSQTKVRNGSKAELCLHAALGRGPVASQV